MKIRTLLVFCILFLSLITLTAQEKGGGGEATIVTARKVSSPSDGNAPRGGRVEFLTLELSAGSTAESIRGVSVRNTTPFDAVFWKIAVLNAWGDEVGTIEDPRGVGEFLITLKDVVIRPYWTERFYLVGDRVGAPSAAVGSVVSLAVSKVSASGADRVRMEGVVPFTGAAYTVNDSLDIGRISKPQRLHQHGNAVVGPPQVIGAFFLPTANIEDISVRSLPFTVYATGDARSLTGVTLIDSNDRVLAGPVDYSYAPEWGKAVFRFNDTFTIPKGGMQVYLKAKIGREFANGGTVTAAINPAEWIAVRGQLYGYELVMGSETIAGPTINVRGPRLDLSVAALPFVTAVAGTRNVSLLSVVLDATESSEDMRIHSLPLTVATLVPYWMNYITFASYEGTTALTESVSSPAAPAVGEKQPTGLFPFGLPLGNAGEGIIVLRGTKRTITIKVNLTGGPAVYAVGLVNVLGAGLMVTGMNTTISVHPNWTPGWTILSVAPDPNGKG